MDRSLGQPQLRLFHRSRFGADARGPLRAVRIAAAELQCQRSLGRRECSRRALSPWTMAAAVIISVYSSTRARRRAGGTDNGGRSNPSWGLPLLSGQSPGPPALTFEPRASCCRRARNTLITRTLVTRTPSALTCWRCESACVQCRLTGTWRQGNRGTSRVRAERYLAGRVYETIRDRQVGKRLDRGAPS